MTYAPDYDDPDCYEDDDNDCSHCGGEDGGAHDEGAYDESCPDCQTLQLARQALSSQGRHEGGEG